MGSNVKDERRIKMDKEQKSGPMGIPIQGNVLQSLLSANVQEIFSQKRKVWNL